MARLAAALCTALGLLSPGSAQQAGSLKKETHVPIQSITCTRAGGCVSEPSALTMDAQWRWVHDARPDMYGNCMKGLLWDSEIVTDGKVGASGCALEGINLEEYDHIYGVKPFPNGVKLSFQEGESIGARLYMMQNTHHYKMFKLLNKEFTFDVDVSTLECGMNGAVYFVEMEEDGGMGTHSSNTAGAKYGTGYCDSQCPRHLKFIDGEANVKVLKNGNASMGKYGACCQEMDIWEANKAATAFTAHPCMSEGLVRCEGDGCGAETPPGCECCDEPVCECCGRYKGICDADGCDFNPFRFGQDRFYGQGGLFDIDTSKPMTVVTQFITDTGNESGDLVEIRRLYVQDGRVIQNAPSKALRKLQETAITDELCQTQKRIFTDHDDTTAKGGLKQLGEALRRGVVLALSLWDDGLTQMDWLDSVVPKKDGKLSRPGVRRGPCSKDSGSIEDLRKWYPLAHVMYANLMVGEINSTYGPASNSARKPIPTLRPEPSTTKPPGPGGAVCCTWSSNGADPCGTCGSGESQGYCATDTSSCGNCGGKWCPNGLTR